MIVHQRLPQEHRSLSQDIHDHHHANCYKEELPQMQNLPESHAKNVGLAVWRQINVLVNLCLFIQLWPSLSIRIMNIHFLLYVLLPFLSYVLLNFYSMFYYTF